MAAKGWTGQVVAAAGAAAGTGAAQLGLGYGLGVVVWPAAGTADDSVWLGSLGWATWIAASATVFGAVIGARFGRAPGGPWRFALAASAAVGALLTVLLVALPARAAVRTDTFSPQTIAAGYAAIGVVLGLLIAYWAVVSRPVATNLLVTAGWLWALAVAAVASDVFWNRPSAAYPSSWQFAAGDGDTYGTIYWPSALLTLLAAFVIGVLGAWPSARRGNLGVGTASSGAVGPLLVAAAFLVLAPQLTRSLGPLESAYLIAPYAVLAGLAGSAATVALGQRREARGATTAAGPTDAADATGVIAVPAQRPASSEKAKPAKEPERPAKGRAEPERTDPTDARGQATAELRGGAVAASKPAATAGPGTPPSFATGRAKPRPPAKTTDPAKPAGTRPAESGPTEARPTQAGPTETGPTRAKPTEARPTQARPTQARPTGAGPAQGRSADPKAAQPADAKPAEARSTVARPPAAPTVAQINPGRTGSVAARKAGGATPAKKAGGSKPAPRQDGQDG
ncbi:Hansenula MRAKII killer toxin-resistant protein 1 [Couchioplanes caeruleus]|uniref:Hansenula MRAKII killer toxin-resistant protein 1 n=1 Tax=Couchioplanes caeruleus TaxID=56438 RepID=UPI0020BE5281|nr:Hansenula MRAKII killer toxin-resistant protein 1 [Couchioplanes caeruleus]UQU64937.1 Hansenula MRAKII killer toxin-resistant protein 1 [Couchioplanes caeruleus]